MMTQARLIVSVDQIGLLRANRGGAEPDPVHFAMASELAGAMGIRAHLRIDRAYLSESDMELLNRMVKTQFFLQVSPHQDLVHLVNSLRPHNVILCAERRDDRAGESGLDASLLARELLGIVKNIDTTQTRVFLFIDPDFDQIKTAAKVGAQGIVLNVRDLMHVRDGLSKEKGFSQLKDSVKLAYKYGLEAHLSGGVQQQWMADLASIPGVSAIHVGHQLVSRSLLLGVDRAVQSYLDVIPRERTK